ncbi:MAG: hypothetical protein CMH83_01490 [Nocardioides sp.]|nr:hypothetical protein [Nocardioides sp.]
MVAGDRLVYFLADDGVHGRELWRTDGTAAGTARLTDLAPGDADAEIDMLGAVTVGDRLYVVASDPDHGRELWTSNGYRGGTHLVRDLTDGPDDSYLGSLTARGRYVFFTRGLDLWVSPGQSRATELLTSYDGNATVNRLVVASGQLVYTRNDGVYQSGVTRGTQGTVLDRGVGGLLGIGRYVVFTVPRGDVTYLGHRRIRAVRPLDTFTTDRVRVGGKPWIGRTVTARHGQWYPRFPDFSYRWTVGSRVLGTTARTLKLRPWMQGRRVRVRVTASKAGYEDASRTSAAKRVVRNPHH